MRTNLVEMCSDAVEMCSYVVEMRSNAVEMCSYVRQMRSNAREMCFNVRHMCSNFRQMHSNACSNFPPCVLPVVLLFGSEKSPHHDPAGFISLPHRDGFSSKSFGLFKYAVNTFQV